MRHRARVERVLREAEAAQAAEREAARQRLLDAARRPQWDGPTLNVPVAPLLTAGQRARSRRRNRT